MKITPVSKRSLLQALAETQEKLEHVTAQLETVVADAAKYREEMEVKVANLERVNAEVTARRDYLETVLKRFLHQAFVRTSESSRYDDLPLFLHRGLDVLESGEQSHEASETDCGAADADESESQQNKSPNKNKGTGRTRARKKKPLPENLPIQTCYVDHDTPPECPECLCQMTHTIRWEEMQELCYHGVPFYILQTFRPVRGCRSCDTVAPLPVISKPFERSRLHETTVAGFVADKCAWGLPIARQQQRFSMHDMPISESMMHGAYRKGAEIVKPIVTALKQSLGEQVCLLDLTHILGRRDSDKSIHGEYKRANLFGALGSHKEVVVTYSESMRNADYLEQYDYVQETFCSDAATGFSHLASERGMAHAKCNNHARRKVWEARFYDRKRVVPAIRLYIALFRIEKEIQGLPPDEKLVHRKQRSKPLCDDLLQWAGAQKCATPPGTLVHKACKYILRHWQELTHFLTDGRVPFHTNDIENIFRIIARGRRAFLQVGSKRGGEMLAIYYTLVISCILIGIDPWLYLTDVFRRVGEHTNAADLIPRKWKELFLEDARKRYCRPGLQTSKASPPPPPQQPQIIPTTGVVLEASSVDSVLIQ